MPKHIRHQEGTEMEEQLELLKKSKQTTEISVRGPRWANPCNDPPTQESGRTAWKAIRKDWRTSKENGRKSYTPKAEREAWTHRKGQDSLSIGAAARLQGGTFCALQLIGQCPSPIILMEKVIHSSKIRCFGSPWKIYNLPKPAPLWWGDWIDTKNKQ